MKHDAKKLRALLERAGLTQVAAARELGMGERMMRHYCAGNWPVPRMVWLALERLIEIRREAH